jgi:mannose-6-phosphate isomerase-like protein (cupin superfamily)
MSAYTVVKPGEGEKYFLVGDHTTFKLGPEHTNGAYTFAETYTKVDGGPPPHRHTREDELFYIVDGTLQFVLNDKSFTAGPGSAVYLPRNVPHAFKNVGKAPAKFLVSTTPAGFETFVKSVGTRVDKVPSDLPVDEAVIGKLVSQCGNYGIEMLFDHKPTGTMPFPTTDRKLWVLGHVVTLKLTGADTNGQYSVIEAKSPPGAFVPPHAHGREDEVFYVVEGTFDFDLDGRKVLAEPGAFVHVPKGVMHGFKNVGTTTARMFDCHTPGGFEAFFHELGAECLDEAKGPPPMPADMGSVVAIFRKHGMTMANR